MSKVTNAQGEYPDTLAGDMDRLRDLWAELLSGLCTCLGVDFLIGKNK